MLKLGFLELIEKANIKHDYKYDYSKSIYINSKNKIEIICPIHGSFWQTVSNHIYNGRGCPKCSNGILLTQDEYINKCKKKHGDFYIYSKVIFTGVKNNVIIMCPIHARFYADC